MHELYVGFKIQLPLSLILKVPENVLRYFAVYTTQLAYYQLKKKVSKQQKQTTNKTNMKRLWPRLLGFSLVITVLLLLLCSYYFRSALQSHELQTMQEIMANELQANELNSSATHKTHKHKHNPMSRTIKNVGLGHIRSNDEINWNLQYSENDWSLLWPDGEGSPIYLKPYNLVFCTIPKNGIHALIYTVFICALFFCLIIHTNTWCVDCVLCCGVCGIFSQCRLQCVEDDLKTNAWKPRLPQLQLLGHPYARW